MIGPEAGRIQLVGEREVPEGDFSDAKSRVDMAIAVYVNYRSPRQFGVEFARGK